MGMVQRRQALCSRSSPLAWQVEECLWWWAAAEEAGAPLACESFNHLSACQMGLGGRGKAFFHCDIPPFSFYTVHGGLRLVLFIWGFPRAPFGTDGNDDGET